MDFILPSLTTLQLSGHSYLVSPAVKSVSVWKEGSSQSWTVTQVFSGYTDFLHHGARKTFVSFSENNNKTTVFRNTFFPDKTSHNVCA